MRNPLKGLNRNVVLLGVVSFLTDVSSEMIFPLIPVFLTSVLGAPVAVVGLIEGVAESTANIFKMVSGVYSDKIRRRKPFVFWGYTFSSVTKPLFALATVWPHVLVIRFLDRVGKGLRGAARDVMIADFTTEKNRGRAYGFRKSMDQVGATLGPFIAFLLLPVLTSQFELGAAYRILFAVSIIPASLAVITLFFVREKAEASKVEKKWSLDFGSMSRAYKVNLLVAGLFFTGVFNYAFLVLRAQDLMMPLAWIPLAYVFYNLVYGAFAVPAGMLSDRLGRRRVIIVSYLLFAVSALGMGLVGSYWLLLVFFATYGVYMAFIETSQRSYIAGLAEPSRRGTALGLYQGAAGFAALPAGIIAGVLWDVTYMGVRATFLYSTAASLAAVILFAGLCIRGCSA